MPKRKLTDETQQMLSELSLKIHKLRAEQSILEGEITDAQVQVIELMKNNGLRNYDAGGVKVTIVEPSRIVIDENRLKRSLGARMWAKVTRTVLDRRLLDACIAVGDVDANVVANCSDEVPSKPYVRTVETDQARATKPRRRKEQ